eukprot:Amastigsp_a515409_29.p3 type:complete len:112 gc:universal Amastigsp_a515409_29:156-491(+)
MMSKPSAICALLMMSGGFTKNELHLWRVKSPLSRSFFLNAAIAGWSALAYSTNGVPLASRCRSIIPNSPSERAERTHGCFAARASMCAVTTCCMAAAFSTSLFLSIHLSDA